MGQNCSIHGDKAMGNGIFRPFTPRKHDAFFQIILVGDEEAGCAQLLTILSSGNKTIVDVKGGGLKVNVLDVGGRKVCLASRVAVGRDIGKVDTIDGVFFAYNMASRKSFMHVKKWLAKVDEVCSAGFPKVLVATKDINSGKRVILAEEGERLAFTYGCKYFENSPFSGTNVDDIFRNLSRQMFLRKASQTLERTISVSKPVLQKAKSRYSDAIDYDESCVTENERERLAMLDKRNRLKQRIKKMEDVLNMAKEQSN